MPSSVRWAARACLAASLVGLGAATVPVASAAATESGTGVPLGAHLVRVTSAAAGAGWIARDVSSTGAIVDAYSHKPSAGDTADAVLALVAAGYGANQVKAAVGWLKHHFGPYVATSGVDNPGSLGLLTLAAVAAGANPTRFGGTSKSNDLVTRLLATERLRGTSAGVFGSPTSSTAYIQSLALLALAAVKDSSGEPAKLGETYLAHQQCADGGWEFSRPTLTTPCPAPNAKTFTGPDTNSTALAVMATVAVGGRFGHSPIAFFKHSEESDASFGYFGVAGDGQVGDPDSTAEVIQALIALGANNDTQFVRNGITPKRALRHFQYWCHKPPSQRGEYRYGTSPSQFATLQAVPAAAGVVFPERPRKLSVAEPRFVCSTA
jgi:hypothetical protein